MKKSITLILIFCSAIAQADFWTQKATFTGGGRSATFSFSIGAKGYMGCGVGATIYKDFWEYDPLTNVWTQLADFGGQPCWYPSGFALNGKGYAGIGYNNGTFYSDFWEYDPGLNQWTQKSNFIGPTRLVPLSLAANNKGYVCCGGNYNDLYEYDPVADAWTQKSNLPGAVRLGAAGFSIGTKLYVGTGESNGTLINDFWEYDIPTDSWLQKASFPGTNRADAAGFSLGGKGYLGTGEVIPFGTFVRDWWEYDPALNQWTQKADYGTVGTDETVCFVIGNHGYVGCGEQGVSQADFWEYCADSICNILMPTSLFTSTNNICPGTCTNFTNLSLNATSFEWSFPGANPSTSTDVNPTNICYAVSGNYDVQLIASNANGSDTLLLLNYITVFPAPAPQGIIQSGDTLFANGGAATYQWYYNGVIIGGATDSFYVATQNGDYNLVATDANGCEVEAVIFNVVTGINATEGLVIKVFPNPAVDKITIQNLATSVSQVTIYNIMGEVVTVQPLLKGQVDVSKLPQGLYSLEITIGEQSQRIKFIKSSHP